MRRLKPKGFRTQPLNRWPLETVLSSTMRTIGFFAKDSVPFLDRNRICMPKSERLKIIRTVHSGRRHVPPEVAARLAEHPEEQDLRTNGPRANQDAVWPASFVSLLLHFALLVLLLAPSPAAAVDPER